MSHTTIYKVPSVGSIQEAGKTTESYRSDISIWMEIMCRCPGWIPNLENWIPGLNPSSDEVKWKALYDLSNSPKLNYFEKVVLVSTFDNVILKKENINTMFNSFRRYADTYGCSENLIEQVKIIDGIKFNASDIGVCWQHNNFFNPWHVGFRLYDVSLDKGHKFLMDVVTKNEVSK